MYKEISPSSGRSMCDKYPNGVRRKGQNGEELAPRSARRDKPGKRLSSCSDAELRKANIEQS